jgi:hypothetical protein
MKQFLFTLTAFIVAILLLPLTGFKHKSTINACAKSSDDKGFVVMELFTSQSCSSCPKAEELLGSYVGKNDSRIIPIAFHVDYWNALGWRDSFSMSQYSSRQEKYNTAYLHTGSVYTPQLIINGEKEFVGSNETGIKKAVDDALNKIPSVTINLKSNTIAKGKITVKYSINGSFGNSSINFVLLQHKTITKIKGGENNGATLINYNVARHLLSTAAKDSGMCMLQLPVGIAVNDLSLVLFTQDKSSGKITGAMKKEL